VIEPDTLIAGTLICTTPSCHSNARQRASTFAATERADDVDDVPDMGEHAGPRAVADLGRRARAPGEQRHIAVAGPVAARDRLGRLAVAAPVSRDQRRGAGADEGHSRVLAGGIAIDAERQASARCLNVHAAEHDTGQRRPASCMTN
jgi:hypothetical protein